MDLLEKKDHDIILYPELTKEIIHIYYKVYNKLGYGFLENIYQNAMYIELLDNGHKVECEKKIEVFYNGRCVGTYYADMVVDNTVILELKAVETLLEAHSNQLTNYLRATEYEVGLLLNFGPEPEFSRRVFSNSRKVGYVTKE